MNYIAKLFLNSLYSRFGIKDLFDKILLLDSKLYFINDIIELNYYYLIQIEEKIKIYSNIQYSYLRQQLYFIMIGTENIIWLKFMPT